MRLFTFLILIEIWIRFCGRFCLFFGIDEWDNVHGKLMFECRFLKLMVMLKR